MESTLSLERLRLARRKRAQQLRRWSAYETDMQGKKPKANKRPRPAHSSTHSSAHSPAHKHVTFTASVALLEAVARNDLEEVRHLLETSVSPDLSNQDGLTALHQCCIDNLEDMMKILLDAGACVNVGDNELWTPLHAAATCGHTGLIQSLIQHGADLMAVNSDGNMPFELCEEDSVLDLMETAMANQGITQAMVDERRASLEQGMLGDIRALLLDGQDANLQNSQGVSLLHVAAAHGLLQAALLLLQGGGRTELRDRDGWEPLHAATCWGQTHVAELLVSHGASLNARTCMDETPIDLCEDEQLRDLLLDLKHKRDIIMRSQLRQPTRLCRRSSSTGSRGKLVRRTSLSDRNSLHRRDCEAMAVRWAGGRDEEEEEEEEGEMESDQEDSQSDNSQDGATQEGGTYSSLVPIATAAPAHPPCVGDLQDVVIRNVPGPSLPAGLSASGRGLTLFELKKQRGAARLLGHAQLNDYLRDGSGRPGSPLLSSNGSALSPALVQWQCGSCLLSSNVSAAFCTLASGDPPLLRLKQPVEELEVKGRSCCRIS